MKKYCALFFFFFCSAISHASEECSSELSSSSKVSDISKIFACFNGKIKALEVQIEEIKGQNKESAIVANKKLLELTDDDTLNPTETVEKQGVTFNLLQCARKNQGEVACNFSVVSNKQDTTLGVYGNDPRERSRAIASGIEYFATSASIGGTKKGDYLVRSFISGISMAVSINFPSIPSDVKRFAVLEMVTGNGFSVQFKNIAIAN